MKVLMLVVISSLFFTTLIFAGDDEAPQKFLDLKPATLPAEKQSSGFTMEKEECKNGLYYSRTLDKCVVSSNTTSFEKSKRELDALKATQDAKHRGKVIVDAKKIGTTQPQTGQDEEAP